ncbi:MAG: M56 family metallopeptidase [Verrucomicrobiales bacterium]
MTTLTLLFDWLTAASLRASLLTAAVLLLQATLQKHLTPRMRYALWLPVLAVLLMPAFPQSRWSVETVFAAAPQPTLITTPAESVMSLPPPDFIPSTPAPEPITWRTILGISWLVGAGGNLLFGLCSHLVTLRRFKQSRQPVSEELGATLAQIAHEIRLSHVPRVWIAPSIQSPAVTGLLRPTLLLPEYFDHAFTPAEARLVLKHELMHLKRHDLPLNALLCLLMTLHWFNPLLWLAFFKIRLDREAACDAQVLQNDSAEQRRQYGHALLKVETTFCPHGPSLGFVGIFQRGAALRSRIRSIVIHRPPHPIMKTTLVFAVILLGFFGITTAAPPDEDAPQVHIVTRFVDFPEGTITFAPPLDASAKTPGVLGVLTAPQLQLLLRQMSSTKGVDLMAAPNVTTKSGQEAKIEVCREFAYKGESGQDAMKKVGVMLTLLPTISGDNQIKLGLSPQIVEFDGMAKTSGGIEQPVFSDRKTKQSVVMSAGQTVVVEMPSKTDTQTVIDRSLFKTTRKKVITVRRTVLLATARLIDKKGQPILSATSLQDKLKSIILPSVEFHDVTIDNALNFFRAKIKSIHAVDNEDLNNINIVNKAANSNAMISLSLKNIPLGEALLEIAKLGNLQLSIVDEIVVLSPKPALKTDGTLYTRTYPASQQFMTQHGMPMTTGSELMTTLTQHGIAAPKDTSIIWNPTTSMLIARATISDHAVIEAWLHPSEKPAANAEPKAPGDKIMLPNLGLQDSKLSDAVEFIRTKARELDLDKKGVNIVIKNGGDDEARISLSLKNIPVSVALRYCADLAGYTLSSDENGYVLTPAKAK